jgi:hypothetical protein
MMEDMIQAQPTLTDAVDIICTVESNYVHQDIQCDACGKVCVSDFLVLILYARHISVNISLTFSQPIVGVRFRCSKCDDYDLCSYCHSVGAAAQHDPDHSFYWIQYRRSSLPPANGEDLELLRRFEQSNNSESFYLHYPWFFAPPIFERLISGTANENESRNLLTQLQESLDGVQLQVTLDGVIRLLAREDWNWREVQDFVKPSLQLQLVRSKYSGLFHPLYLAVKDGNDLKQGQQSGGAEAVLTLRKQLFDAHLDSVSAERCKDAMNGFLAARVNKYGAVEVPMQMDRISESARYTEILSKGFDVRVQRRLMIDYSQLRQLNSPSLPIFEEVEALLKRRKPGPQDVGAYPKNGYGKLTTDSN